MLAGIYSRTYQIRSRMSKSIFLLLYHIFMASKRELETSLRNLKVFAIQYFYTNMAIFLILMIDLKLTSLQISSLLQTFGKSSHYKTVYFGKIGA